MFKKLHHRFVFRRRVKVLSAALLTLINPAVKTILDIGCGDGTISKLMQDNNAGLKLSGIDIMERQSSLIPVTLYDGKYIPYDDDSFDCSMIIDVLHHLTHIKELIAEAKRVSRKYILVKDHQYKNNFDFKVLKFMDKAGNKPYGVALQYNYLKAAEWDIVFKDAGLNVLQKTTTIPLYPFPFNMLFGRRLHFVCLLEIVK
jgi:ubiquinone/menaquinone biosynthesis C-methylase UbiE